MPPVLGHGALVTSDMLAAVMLVLASRSFWSFLVRPTSIRAILSGLTLGLAACTKFTLLILYPCWAVLLAARVLQPGPVAAPGWAGLSAAPRRFVASGVVVFAVSLLVVNGLYLFQDVGVRLERFKTESHLSRVLDQMRRSPATAWMLTVPLPIPVEILRGLDVQLADSHEAQPAYLLGQTRLGGWPYWYAAAALIKIPLPASALFLTSLLGLRTLGREPDRVRWAALCLLVPALEAALAIASSTGTGMSAAFRYLIPSLSLLCIWVGRAARNATRLVRIAIIGLLTWSAMNAVMGLPDYLSWQNELGWAWERWKGCPALIGDSLDWGQDLSRLGEWVVRHDREGSTVVCVYGLGNGEPYGLKPPAARPTSAPLDGAAYLAVSENIICSYSNINKRIQIGGAVSSLSPGQREGLIRAGTFDRVGRSIRIYHVVDPPVQRLLKE
jgi:hypothetical protein